MNMFLNNETTVLRQSQEKRLNVLRSRINNESQSCCFQSYKQLTCSLPFNHYRIGGSQVGQLS